MANIKISELNELTQKENNDYVPIVDTSADETKKIAVKDLIPSNVTLLAVSSTEPEECYTGDKYFNTTTNLIYTAIERNVWSTTGELAQMGINYIVFDTQTVYAYNGTTLVSVGSASGSVVNSYSTSTIEGYSCDYINTLQTYSTTEQRVGTWINDKPIYRRVFTLGTPILLNASWQTVFSVSGMNIEAITKLETLNNNDIAWNGTISRINNNNLQLYYIGVGGAEWYVGKVILEYTKTTD